MSEDTDTLKEYETSLLEFERMNTTVIRHQKLKDELHFPIPEESFYIPAHSSGREPAAFTSAQDSSDEEEKY